MKNFIILLLLFTVKSSYAIDLQNKIYNSDKSYFEAISSPQILNNKEFSTFVTYSIQKFPIIIEEKALIDGLHSLNTSLIYGLSNNIELGANFSFIQTLTNEDSDYESYSGLSDGLLELKYNLFKNVSVIPQYIISLNNGSPLSGTTEGGYGLKIASSFFQDATFPVYLNYGIYSLPENTLLEINQSQRSFFSIGSIYSLNNNFDLGFEYFHDQAKNHSPKELLSHLTFDNSKLLVRSGFGYGLNEEKINEFRFFVTLGFNFSFSKEIKERRDKLNNDFLLREINSVENSNKSKEEEMLSNSSLKNESEDLDDHSVVPFYTVKEVKQMEEKKENKQEKKLVEKKYNRLKMAYSSLDYFVDLHKKNKISKEKALTEFAWGLRVIKMRRDTLNKLENKTDNDYKQFDQYKKEKDFEKYAKDFIKNNKQKLKEIRKKLKNEDKEEMVDDKETSNVELKDEIDDVNKRDWTALTKEEEELKKQQEIAWEVSKTKTLMDLQKEKVLVLEDKKEKKNLSEEYKEKNEEEIKKKTSEIYIMKKEVIVPEIVSISDDLTKKEDIKEKKESLLEKINNKLKIKFESNSYDYSNFYNQYKKTIIKEKEEKIKKKEMEVDKIIIESFIKDRNIKNKEENEEIDIRSLKKITIEKVEESNDSNQVKDDFLNNFYEENESYDDATIYEDSDIEKSLGPRY